MKQGEAPVHLPVMEREVTRFLTSREVDALLDATVGAGGHARALLEAAGPKALLVGLDRDPEMLEIAKKRLAPFGDRVRLLCRSFADLQAALREAGVDRVDGALFDLGANSVHFDRPDRGFSFLFPGPLDMRFDRSGGETAEDLVNRLPEADLAEMFREQGGERHAERIARAIVAERPIRDTVRLAEVVRRAVGRRGRIHPATRVFQALRIAVNRELEAIERGIPAAIRKLRPGGALVVISFHSGEDRIVKRILAAEAAEGRVRYLAKKPLRPRPEEVRLNPRARSAKARAVEKEGDG